MVGILSDKNYTAGIWGQKLLGSLTEELREVRRELESVNEKAARSKLDALVAGIRTVGDFRLLTGKLEMKADAVRSLLGGMGDASLVSLVACVDEGKLNFVCICGADAVKAGANAGKIVREVCAVCGGKGGGRPDSAMGAGTDHSRIAEALAKVEELL